MSHRQNYENNDVPLTLEDAYSIFDRLNPFHASGPPSIDMIGRLRGHPAARKKFYGRQTLLHKCCCDGYGERLDLVDALVKIYPLAVERYDEDGFWPLHYVVASVRGRRHGRPMNSQVLELLIRLNPLALLQTTRNDRRAIPLHLACENPALTIEVLDILLRAFPETIHYRDANENFPIDCALQTSGMSVEVLQRIIDASSVLLSFVRDGNLILHDYLDRFEAVGDEETHSMSSTIHLATVLERLIETSPGTLRIQTRDNKSPLVMACENDISISCIFVIVRAWPEQITTHKHLVFSEKDGWNGVWLPTHLLQSNLCMDDVFRWLEEDPRATTTADAAGRLALHYAVVSRAKCALKLVRAILDANPAALTHPDNAERLPLHYLSLSTHQDRDELLMLLLANGTSSLEARDEDGCLPWMYAELVQFYAIWEASVANGIPVDSCEDSLPSEVRWDIVQVMPPDDYVDNASD